MAPRMRSRPAWSRCAAPAPRGVPSWCWRGLPTVEIELALDHAVARGDVLPVRLAKIRLFAA